MDLNKDFSFQLDKQEVHFWYCSFASNQNEMPLYQKLLSEDEVLKADKFKFQKDRECYIISRGILRMLIGKYLHTPPQDIIFEYSMYGKPSIVSKTNLKFNISHSGNRAVFGFISNLEIGVDVEKIKTDFDALDLAQNFFSKTEIKPLENQPELYKAFYRCWTRKEAFIKAKGSGLSFPLDAFAVSLGDDKNAQLLETQWDASEATEWKLFSFVPSDGYISAIALQATAVSVSYRNWDVFSSLQKSL